MPLAIVAHNSMLSDLAARANKVQLLSTITLTAAVAANATTVTVSNANVQVGDWISLNNDAGTLREAFRVTGKSGSTMTLDRAVVNPYANGSSVGWAPKAGTSLVTLGSTADITWSAPANETIGVGASVTIPVAAGSAIGSFALFNSTQSSQFLGTLLTNNIERFGAAGDYVLTTADISLSS